MSDLESAGVSVQMSGRTWTVEHGDVQLPSKVVVEPDLSNAAPFLGAALIAGGVVRVPNWPASTTQPGGLLPGYLARMGAEVTVSEEDGIRTLIVRSDRTIHGLGEFDLSAAGEIAPSLAAILVFADAPTELVGIGHLRGHETNRLEALVKEIRRVGGDAEELQDGLRISPVAPESLHGAVMETYADHRMATFAAMLGLRLNGIDVVNVETTRKTIPDFTGLWNGMLSDNTR